MNLSLFQERIFPVRSKLFRFAFKITGNRHEAEDVVQEVMEKAWKMPKDQSESVLNWEAWCMTLTRNRSIDKTRSREIRRAAPIETAFDHKTDEASPAHAAETGDLVKQVRKFMQELPEKQRLVMHLRDVEEMTYEEIAQTLDISLEVVKVSLHRARKSVREKMLGLESV